MMLFVCYPKCSTCQKAKKWLDEKGVSYTLRDIKTENPTQEELRAWWQRSGLPLKKFFNTSGQLYKAMNLKEKLPGMSEEEQLALLATDGMLVKRPILVGDSFVKVGFREAEWEQAVERKSVCVKEDAEPGVCRFRVLFCAKQEECLLIPGKIFTNFTERIFRSEARKGTFRRKSRRFFKGRGESVCFCTGVQRGVKKE